MTDPTSNRDSLESMFISLRTEAELREVQQRCAEYRKFLFDLKVVLLEDEDLEEAQRLMKELFGEENEDQEPQPDA